MSKIHFVCLFGVEYELDLFPWWSRHYLDRKFDSYHVFLHQQEGRVPPSVIKKFTDAGFTYRVLDGGFYHQGNGLLRREALQAYAASLPAQDLLVTADADEFHTNPGIANYRGDNLPTPHYRLLEKHYDVIGGFMVDRWTGALVPCERNPFEQYPHEEEFTKEILKAVTPPYLKATHWPDTRRTKVLAARAGYAVGYEGSHCFYNIPVNARIAEDFRVIHFAWRESARRKVAVKAYFTQENLDEVFGGKAPQEYKDSLARMKPDLTPA